MYMVKNIWHTVKVWSTVWNPYNKGDIEAIENVQRRASKIPLEMKKLSYEERLKVWNLTTLEERRTRGDLIQMYKIRNELENIQWFRGPQLAPHTNTRSETQNNFRLSREPFSSRACNDYGHYVSVRDEFFVNRVVKCWNELSNYQILAPSLNSFKARIDA